MSNDLKFNEAEFRERSRVATRRQTAFSLQWTFRSMIRELDRDIASREQQVVTLRKNAEDAERAICAAVDYGAGLTASGKANADLEFAEATLSDLKRQREAAARRLEELQAEVPA